MNERIVNITNPVTGKEEFKLFPDLRAALFFIKCAGFTVPIHDPQGMITAYYDPSNADKAVICTPEEILTDETILESWR